MVGAALEALLGEEPGDEALAAAVSTIPTGELPDALRLLVQQHGATTLPLLRRCLAGRAEWATAAALALATLPSPEAAAALADAEPRAPGKAVRTAIRRALYRLRQGGITPPAAPAPPPAPVAPTPRQAWVSAVDGTGSRGVWVALEDPLGGRTLLSGIVNDAVGLLDGAGGPVSKKRLDQRLAAMRADSPLPWVAAPAAWALGLLAGGARRAAELGRPLPADLAPWRATLEAAPAVADPPIHAVVSRDDVAADPGLLERSGALLESPELAGWFLDPPSVQAEALELLQAQESRLVVSDQVKEERRTAVLDRVIDAHFDVAPRDTRRLWQRRLEDQGWVFHATGRPAEARQALAVALALADPERSARRIPFVRALVERSLEVAGEVALGRLSAEEMRRVPRAGGPRAHPVAAAPAADRPSALPSP